MFIYITYFHAELEYNEFTVISALIRERIDMRHDRLFYVTIH